MYPKKQSETKSDLVDMILRLSSTIGCDLKREERKRNSSIVVETSSTMYLGFLTSEDMPIFIGEQLTTKDAHLYYLARDLAKSAQYKFCWTVYGKVYVRKTETSQVVCIKSEAQVELGVVPLPKSVTKSHIEQNIDIFDFQLTDEEKNVLKSFNKGYRFYPQYHWQDHPYYPYPVTKSNQTVYLY
ncbi:unnamed protein product [Euphydryas editha]|uniref:FP protein C-terminal domain-containing protein n=1 Tax=Euphydryas editha TaxID=104508 RepID=A0AAU9TCI1_EUPED|nr:unnamed protein product [Euphydryas editha]